MADTVKKTINLGNVQGVVISDTVPKQADGAEKRYVIWAKPYGNGYILQIFDYEVEAWMPLRTSSSSISNELKVWLFGTVEVTDPEQATGYENFSEAINDALKLPTKEAAGSDNLLVVYDPVTKVTTYLPQSTVQSKTSSDIRADLGVGNIKAGDVIPKGTDLQKLVEALISATFMPTFTEPSLHNPASRDEEVGTNSRLFRLLFNRGNILGANNASGVWSASLKQGDRAGEATGYVMNGEPSTSPNLVVPRVTVLGNNSVNISVTHLEGDQPFDSKNNPVLTKLPAGTVSAVSTWKGYYNRFYGSVAKVPTNSAEVRALIDVPAAGTYNLTTGTINTNFVVCLPPGSKLTAAIDVGSLGADILFLYKFVKKISVNIGGSSKADYDMYVMSLPNPYTDTNTHKLTIT